MVVTRLKHFVAGRVSRLREKMCGNGLDGLIITEPVEVRYLTGFSGDDSVLVMAARRKVLVTDSRYIEQVRQECPGLPIKIRKGPISEAAGEVLIKWDLVPERSSGKKKIPIVGIDPDAVTVSQFKNYRKAIGKGIKQTKSPVTELRQCKDNYEIKQINKAVRVAEAAIKKLLAKLKIGISEREAAAQLEYEMARLGGAPPAFESIVAWGPHAAQPHARPGNARLRKGQTILIDWGATVEGYKSDLTRCYSAGKIRPVFADVYKCVLEAQMSAIDTVRPGVGLAEVDAAARKTLRKGLKKLSKSFGVYEHGTGHGLGLNVHESPLVSKRSKGELKEGMVITIEPGIYVPGKFGIRIEDDVQVTARGRKVLSRLGKDPESVSLYGA